MGELGHGTSQIPVAFQPTLFTNNFEFSETNVHVTAKLGGNIMVFNLFTINYFTTLEKRSFIIFFPIENSPQPVAVS